MKIAIATDTCSPQVNGVVRTLEKTGERLAALGHQVVYVTPEPFTTVPCPSYRSIRLAVAPGRGVARRLASFDPDALHIATEGPIGTAARAFCRRHGLTFTTSYHTQFPEYIRLRVAIPLSWTYAYLRRFHGSASRTLVPTPSLQRGLSERGFRNVVVWPRGVDTDLFRPRAKAYIDAPRPVCMYVGRVAVEKNLEAFLCLDLPGSKFVVGDGPDLAGLRQRCPDAYFVGCKRGEELACYLAAADVFVFPSLTDTFGLVLLEAMACGVPVAAYPVTGPIDVVVPGETGYLHQDLRRAVLAALDLDGAACVDYARAHSWERCAEVFLAYLDRVSSAKWDRDERIAAMHPVT